MIHKYFTVKLTIKETEPRPGPIEGLAYVPPRCILTPRPGPIEGLAYVPPRCILTPRPGPIEGLAYVPRRCRTSHFRSHLFPSQYRCGTILVTLYSMVWD